eukprot:gene24613-30981_t
MGIKSVPIIDSCVLRDRALFALNLELSSVDGQAREGAVVVSSSVLTAVWSRETLNVTGNKLTDISIGDALSSCLSLKALFLSRNPIARVPNYRIIISAMLSTVEMLDGTPVSHQTCKSQVTNGMILEAASAMRVMEQESSVEDMSSVTRKFEKLTHNETNSPTKSSTKATQGHISLFLGTTENLDLLQRQDGIAFESALDALDSVTTGRHGGGNGGYDPVYPPFSLTPKDNHKDSNQSSEFFRDEDFEKMYGMSAGNENLVIDVESDDSGSKLLLPPSSYSSFAPDSVTSRRTNEIPVERKEMPRTKQLEELDWKRELTRPSSAVGRPRTASSNGPDSTRGVSPRQMNGSRPQSAFSTTNSLNGFHSARSSTFCAPFAPQQEDCVPNAHIAKGLRSKQGKDCKQGIGRSVTDAANSIVHFDIVKRHRTSTIDELAGSDDQDSSDSEDISVTHAARRRMMTSSSANNNSKMSTSRARSQVLQQLQRPSSAVKVALQSSAVTSNNIVTSTGSMTSSQTDSTASQAGTSLGFNLSDRLRAIDRLIEEESEEEEDEEVATRQKHNETAGSRGHNSDVEQIIEVIVQPSATHSSPAHVKSSHKQDHTPINVPVVEITPPTTPVNGPAVDLLDHEIIELLKMRPKDTEILRSKGAFQRYFKATVSLIVIGSNDRLAS